MSHSRVVFIAGVFIYFRIKTSFVRLLQRSPAQHFPEIEFQLPEGNELTEYIVGIILSQILEVGMRTSGSDNPTPCFGVSVSVGDSHVFDLYAGGLAENGGLYVLGHDVVRHFRVAAPQYSRTGLIAMSYLVCRSPASACLQLFRTTDFIHCCSVVGCVISRGVHIGLIHDIQIHPVSEHLVIFLQAQQLLLAVHDLVIKVYQFISLGTCVGPEVTRLESEVGIFPQYVKIPVGCFVEQFRPASVMLRILRVEVAVHFSRCKMDFDWGR